MQATRRMALAVIAVAAVGSSCPEKNPGGVTDTGQTPFYAQTAWASIHRDARNSDFAPFVAPAANRVEWEALGGAVTLLAASIGPEGNRYVTTGRGPGTSHLHAFDRDGNLLWESPPQSGAADLDSAAVASAVLVDRAGDVYVGDSDQLWAFHPDGTLKWVADLPTPGSPSSRRSSPGRASWGASRSTGRSRSSVAATGRPPCPSSSCRRATRRRPRRRARVSGPAG